MRKFQGIPISPGVAIAEAFRRESETGPPPARRIEPEEVHGELERLAGAVEGAREELDAMAFGSGLAEAVRSIAASHREFLSDPTLLGEVERSVREDRWAANYAVALVFGRWIEKFKALEDEFFRQRYVDLLDLERRVRRHLRGTRQVRTPTPERPAVLIGRELTPSEAADLDRRSVVGFATEMGGSTSHTAIIAKSLGIPAVCGLGRLVDTIPAGTILIVDGEAGLLVVEPDESTLQHYRDRKKLLDRRFRILRRMAEIPAETLDGWPVGVHANIEFPFEVEQAVRNGADGIGLFRTEFLYAEHHAVPEEEEHYAAYREALDRLHGRPLVVRTFDFGADKFAREIDMVPEANPNLGCRSIRYSFAHPEVFRVQLRAILRASADGRVSLMFPMISSVSEIRRARRILEQVTEELRQDGVSLGAELPVGAMVEIPSASVAANLLAREVEFFSIGTNDLTQYTLAVDRSNERVASLFRPSNPAILWLLQHIATEADRAGIQVSICGEMGSERAYTLLLLGLGIRHFSVAPAAVPLVKRVIRVVTRRKAAEITARALELATPEEVDAYLEEQADKLLPDV